MGRSRHRHASATRRARRWRLFAAATALTGLVGTITVFADRFWRSGPINVDEMEAPTVQQPHLLTGSDAAQFPIYAPQYPGSSVTDAQHLVDPAGATMMIRFDSSDPATAVADFYMRALNDKAFRPTLRHLDGRLLVAGGRTSAGLSVLVEARPAARGSGTEGTLTISDYRPTRPANMDVTQ